jgi:unsaturated chondroitin disaccharide hydrolase
VLPIVTSTLGADGHLAWSTPGWEGVLEHGVYYIHKKLGVDESVMWGDSFFLECLDKVLGIVPERRSPGCEWSR